MNSTCGFLYGWTASIILKPGSAAIIAAGFARLCAFVWPSVAQPVFVWRLGAGSIPKIDQIALTRAQLFAVALVVLAMLINYFGIRAAGGFQVLLTASKIAALAAIIVLGLWASHRPGTTQPITTFVPRSNLSAVLTALVPVMMAYNGFGILGHVGGEIVSPQKNLPRAAVLGSASVIVLYCLINWTYFRVLGFSAVVQSEHVASDVLATTIGACGAMLMTLAMLISAFGSLHANLLASPRVPYAMSRDGAFFHVAERIQPVFHTPSGALIFEACAAIALVLTGTYQEIYSLAMFAYWSFYALTAIALIALRIREPELARPCRAWGYPWSVLIFVIVALAISANLWWIRPVRSSLGLGIILIGLPFFYCWRKQRTSTYADQLAQSPRDGCAISVTDQYADVRSSLWRAGT
jgi:APA family basic amino acid/polyamine antiporter